MIYSLEKYFILGLFFLVAVRSGTRAQSAPKIEVPYTTPGQNFVYRSGRSYDNRAFEDWLYPDILARGPYRNYYGPMGDHIFRGFDVFSWRETRTTEHPGDVDGSELSKFRDRFRIFDQTVVVSETHLDWAARLFISEEFPNSFTPLTLKISDFNGARMDVQTRRAKFSLMGARFSEPVWSASLERFTVEEQAGWRNTDLLFGGHGEVQIGTLTLGATGINYHLFDSRQPLFELKGQVQSTQPLPKWVVARFADDSPEDQRGGAVVSEVRLWVNGEPRPDLQPFFVRINTRNPTAVGRTSRITGVFTPTRYPDQDTRFADVFYLIDHLQGEDVGRSVNVELLERFTEVLPAAAAKRADGEHMVLAYFDLSEEAYVQSVQVEALVGNDYKMDVKGIYQSKTRGNYEDFFAVETLSGVRRSKGNVQDQANLDWVRLDSGVFTGRTTLGLNGKWEVPGARVQWEYARGVAFRQYPDGQPEFRSTRDREGLRLWKGLRSDRSDEAYYLTAQWRRGWLEAGGEVFSIGPHFDHGFVEDNDDHDRWPDNADVSDRGGIHLGDPGGDPDGVFPGKDQDNDGVPDTNRNGNDIPDYDEAFLLFEVEPDEYVYGRDWNHNGVVDHRENDFRPDYPYTPDQRGYHLFGRWHLPGGLALGLGQQRARGIAFGGRNHSAYTYLTFEAERSYWGRVFAETLIQRVEDDIEDTYQTYEEVLRSAEAAGRGFSPMGGLYYRSVAVRDPLDYRDSMDWQYYVEGEWTPILGVRLAGNARYELNRQREVIFADGTGQGADRLKLTTSVLKAEYVWTPATRWQITGQWKGLWLRRTRESASVPLVDLWTSIPFFKVRYDITARTSFQLGFQGLPGLPLKERDLADRRNDMEEEVRAVQLSNRSPYFGYQISMNLGMRVFRRRFDDPDRSADEEDVTSAFMRVFLGWDE